MTDNRSKFDKAVSKTITRLDETTQKLRAVKLRKEPDPAPKMGENVSGRVRHDERGNAVWDLAVATGVFALESTAKFLKKLEAPELKIEDDKELKIEDKKRGGYDPYNRR